MCPLGYIGSFFVCMMIYSVPVFLYNGLAGRSLPGMIPIARKA